MKQKTLLSQSQSQSHSDEQSAGSRPKSAEMETMAQHRASMDDSFHLPNFPHMAWVDPSALPTIVIMPSLRARLECIFYRIAFNDTQISQRVPHPHTIPGGRCLTYVDGMC